MNCSLRPSKLEAKKDFSARIARFVPTVSAVVAVAGFLIGVYAMTLQNKRENDLREKEFKKVFWEKQAEAYREVSSSTARLATLNTGEERDKEFQRFKQLYHGQMILFMDDNVARALKAFAETYIDYENDPRLQTRAQEASRVLAKACADSLQKTWDIPLKEIDLNLYR